MSHSRANPRAGHTGRVRARERMRKESNLIDWVMQNAVAWVRARAIGRECAVARRCRRRCFGRRSIFRTYFQGAKEGGGGLLYSRISLSEAAAGSVFWREPMSLARRAALRRVVYSPLRFLLFLFLSCNNNNNNTEPFFDLCKILQDETRKNGTKAQHSGWRHGEDERSIRLRHWSERRTPPRFQPHRED